MAAHVFISHSSKDRKLSGAMCAALEKRGLACWISWRDIAPGEIFQAAIVRAIRDCKAMVLIFSGNANGSGEIVKELTLASQYDLVIIPARVEDVFPSEALEYELATKQWVDAFPPPWDEAIDRIVVKIRANLPKEPDARAPSPGPEPAPAVEEPEPRPAATVPPAVAPPTVPSAEPVPRPAPAPSPAQAVSASAKRRRGAVLWNLATGQISRSLEFPLNEVSHFAFSPTGKRMVASGTNGVFCVSDGETGQPLFTSGGKRRGHHFVIFTRDGRWIVSGNRGITGSAVEVWDVANGSLVRALTPVTGQLYAIAASPDCKTVATASDPNGIVLWDVATGQARGNLQAHAGGIRSIAFSPDGRRIASGNYNGSITVWDIAAARIVSTLWHLGTVNAVAFSPDGGRIVAGGYGGTVPVWDAKTNRRVYTLKEHAATVRDVAFSPDGRLIASGSDDRTIKLWDAATGNPIRTIDTRSASKHAAGALAFSPDGKSIAMVSDYAQIVDAASRNRAYDWFASGIILLVLQYGGAALFHWPLLGFDSYGFYVLWGVVIYFWIQGFRTLERFQREQALKQQLEK
jgi:tricorn protease-like protein